MYADIFSIVVCTEQSAGLCSCNHIFNDCNQSKPSSAQIYAQRLEGNRYFIVIYGCDEFIFDKRRRDTGTFLDFYNYRTRAESVRVYGNPFDLSDCRIFTYDTDDNTKFSDRWD